MMSKYPRKKYNAPVRELVPQRRSHAAEERGQEQGGESSAKGTQLQKWIPPKQRLGASQFAAALGLSGFLTPGELRNRLEVGYYWESQPSLRFGHQNERLAKYYYQKITGTTIRRASLVKDPACLHLVGIGDGLIGNDGGIEIKCHYERESPLKEIPIYYLVQVAAYLYLYNRCWWDFMSCCFTKDSQIKNYKIIRVTKEEIADAWEREWYPQLLDYVDSIQWAVDTSNSKE